MRVKLEGATAPDRPPLPGPPPDQLNPRAAAAPRRPPVPTTAPAGYGGGEAAAAAAPGVMAVGPPPRGKPQSAQVEAWLEVLGGPNVAVRSPATPTTTHPPPNSNGATQIDGSLFPCRACWSHRSPRRSSCPGASRGRRPRSASRSGPRPRPQPTHPCRKDPQRRFSPQLLLTHFALVFKTRRFWENSLTGFLCCGADGRTRRWSGCERSWRGTARAAGASRPSSWARGAQPRHSTRDGCGSRAGSRGRVRGRRRRGREAPSGDNTRR